jgi:hypothetical protein
MTPDALAPFPTTDGGPFHVENVPLVNFLTAPFYLFDRMDNVDKIDAPSLLPVTRAAIRIIESTRNRSDLPPFSGPLIMRVQPQCSSLAHAGRREP